MRNLESKYPNKLKELRKKHRLLQKDIAEKIGLHDENRICRWEKGQSIPSFPNLLKLAKLFNVPMEDIYSELK
jgi:DNA-binding XRE family transcriptional regulator